MEPVLFGFIIAANIAIVGGTYAWRYFRSEQYKVRRAIKRAQRVPLAGVVDGSLVRVTGEARPRDGQHITAPLTGRACLLYEVIVEEYVSRGKSGSWKTIITEKDFVPTFWLAEGGERALVKLDFPMVLLDQDASFRSGILKEPDEVLVDFLAQHLEAAQGLIFNRNLRYREGIIARGEQVTVLAVAKTEPDPDPAAVPDGYRSRAMRLVLRSPAQGEMMLSDKPGLTRKS